jgi:hypothetical protein
MSIKPRNLTTGLLSVCAMGLSTFANTSQAQDISAQLLNIQAPIAASIGIATGGITNATVSTAPVVSGAAAGMTADLLPPNATPGQCYARIWAPPKFETTTETVETKPAGERLEVIPAKYETVTERVLVKEASEKLVTVPATYETVSEKVLVKDSETHWHYGRSGLASAQSKNALHPDASYVKYAQTLGVPDAVSAGQCFAEYIVPAKYDTVTERMLKTESSQRIEIIPAVYEDTQERVLVSEASEKLVTVAAEYETVTEKVLVEPAYTTWKVSECSGGACAPGEVPNRVAGSVDRIDQSTGEIMCLVEVPAKYKTITKRVLKSPATTKSVTTPAQYQTQNVRKLKTPAQERVIDIPETYQTITKTVKTSDPSTTWYATDKSSSASGNATGNVLCYKEKPAIYKTVSRQVVKTPASTKSVEVPAVYKTVEVRKMVASPQEKRIEIPATYGQVTKTDKVSEGSMEWRPVLCQANMTRSKIKEIQTALKTNGHYYGPIDGVVGSQTINAMQKFQRAKNLTTTRFLTIESVKELGVSPTH